MEQINHAMVAVGYHHEKGYLLKDSRGYINGLAGYIWVNKDESLNAGVCRHGFSVTPDLTDYPDAKFSKEDCCNTFF